MSSTYIMDMMLLLLTIYFCYEAYNKNSMSKKIFIIISIVEGIIVVSPVVFKIM